MKISNSKMMAHVFGVFTAVLWGTTFISTKVLLEGLAPINVLLYRFIIGYVVLVVISPKPLAFQSLKEEFWYMAAGLSGVTIYFLFENIALTYTLASNVGVIVSTAPMFTAIFAFIFLKTEKPKLQFFIGFLVAITGILLINYNGRIEFHLNPIGDILSVCAAFVWAVYSIILKKHIKMGKNMIAVTRRIFFYGLLGMIPFALITGVKFDLALLATKSYLPNLLYLGIGASAICYVTWNKTIEMLGAVKASVYIYIVPVITIIASGVILHEPITRIVILGAALAIAGLLISEKK